MGRLADSLLLSKSGVTRLVDRLVDDGLVERTSCSGDGRGAEATLTGLGLARLRAAAPTHLAGIRAYFFDAVDPADLPALERALTSVTDRLCHGATCGHGAAEVEAAGTRPDIAADPSPAGVDAAASPRLTGAAAPDGRD